MTNDYKPGERIRATLEAEVHHVVRDGVWVVCDEEVYAEGVGIQTYVPYAAITEKIEPPAPAWIEGDIVYGHVSGALYTRGSTRWSSTKWPNDSYADHDVSADVGNGAARAIVRGGEVVR